MNTKPNKGSFKPGNPGKPKGTLAKTTRTAMAMGLQLNRDVAMFMNNEGFDRFITEMLRLHGYQYTTTYLSLLEYVKPKLSRMDIVQDKEKMVINVFGKALPGNEVQDIKHEDIPQQDAPITSSYKDIIDRLHQENQQSDNIIEQDSLDDF